MTKYNHLARSALVDVKLVYLFGIFVGLLCCLEIVGNIISLKCGAKLENIIKHYDSSS